MNKIIVFMLTSLCLISNELQADVLPPGHKSIQHQIVFESSPLLDDHRLVAAPIRGFQGAHVVVPGEPFQFSSKYGTQFYLIPKSEPLDLKFDRDAYQRWPSAVPPVSQIASVPVTSPISAATTTVRFSEVRDGKPVIIVVDHKELDSSGQPASYWRAYWWLIIPIVGGVALLAVVFRGLRSGKGNLGPTKDN